MKDFFNTKIIKNTKIYWIYIVTLIISFTFWWILAIRFPIANYIPYWFWVVITSSRSAWWLVFPLLALSIGVILVIRKTSRSAVNILVLITAGVIVQHTFGLMEGRGIDGIRHWAVDSGHAAFTIDALNNQHSFLFVASFYDYLITRKILPDYPHSTKPPGQFLFYMLNERAARFLPGAWDSRLPRMATFMTIVWPVLACLPVIFIYILSREIHKKNESNIIASLLYIFIPSVILIPLHLDQVLYPLLFIFMLVIFVFGIKKNSMLLLFISGLVTGIALFISFSLIAILFYILLILMIKTGTELLSKEQAFSRNPIQIIRENLKIGLVYALGLFILEACLFLNLSYNVVENYQYVMSNHFSAKTQIWSPQITLAMGALNILEYALWTGVPLFGLMVVYGIRSLKKLLAGNTDMGLIMGFATPILFFALALFGKTAGEIARLWIFLTPLTVIFSAKEIANTFRERTWHTVTFLILLQLITAFSLKMWQDF